MPLGEVRVEVDVRREQWALAQPFPHATYAVLDGAGHNAQIEQPEVFGALVRARLDRVSRAG